MGGRKSWFDKTYTATKPNSSEPVNQELKRIPRINIMDSISFLIGPLDKLAQQLFADGHHMSLLKGSRLCQIEIGEFSSQKFNLLTRKCIVIS